MFFSRVVGGPDIDNPHLYEICLHEVTLSYLLPRGFQGICTGKRQVINYRNKLAKFKPDFYGNECLKIDGAVWDYHRYTWSSRLLPLPLDTLGNLSFRLKLHKLPENLTRGGMEDSLADYIRYFLHNFLEGEKGYNSRRRKNSPDESDEELSGELIKTPNQLERRQLGDVKWTYFRLNGYPYRRRFTDYYFTLLNNEFALSLELVPSAQHQKERERKQVEATNRKAMDMILNSIKLEFE